MLPQQWTGTVIGDRVIRVKSSKAVPVFMYFGGSFVAFYKGNFKTPEVMSNHCIWRFQNLLHDTPDIV
jgi:hypothetical protein